MAETDFMVLLLVVSIVIIFFIACAAGVAIAAACIGTCAIKIIEKAIKAIENFFNNL